MSDRFDAMVLQGGVHGCLLRAVRTPLSSGAMSPHIILQGPVTVT